MAKLKIISKCLVWESYETYDENVENVKQSVTYSSH